MRFLGFATFVVPMLGLAAELEVGTVVASDGGALLTNAYPVIERLGDGRLVTAFTVMPKGVPDAYIAVAVSRDNGKTWGAARKALDVVGVHDGDPSLLWDGSRLHIYTTSVPMNRTLIATSKMFEANSGDGNTWTEPREIAVRFQYSVGKRHRSIRINDGTYLMPISWDLWAERGTPARTEGEMNLASGVLKSADGVEWRPFGWLHTSDPKVRPGSTGGLCEPSLVELADGEIYMLLRAGGNYHYEARSRDGGVTWSAPRRSPLQGHNTPSALLRLAGSNDIVAVWNNSPVNRYPLSAALSGDGGRTWTAPKVLADSDGPQVSYPNAIQAADGAVVAVWQAQRKEGGRDIKWARFTREWLRE